MSTIDALYKAAQKAVANPWGRADRAPRWRERSMSCLHNGYETRYIVEDLQDQMAQAATVTDVAVAKVEALCGKS